MKGRLLNKAATESQNEPYLTDSVITGFKHTFSNNTEYLKHLHVLRSYRNYTVDLIAQNPDLKNKMQPFFETLNEIVGILTINPKVIKDLPNPLFNPYKNQ